MLYPGHRHRNRELSDPFFSDGVPTRSLASMMGDARCCCAVSGSGLASPRRARHFQYRMLRRHAPEETLCKR